MSQDQQLPLPTSFEDTQQLLNILKSDDCSLPHKEHLKSVQMEYGTKNEHLGLVARVDLNYDDINNEQQQQKQLKTVVVKMSPVSPSRQGHASMLHLLEREVLFYRRLKPRIPEIQPKEDLQPSIPECYYAAVSNDKSQQLIVLEDLAPSKCGSLTDSPSPDEARQAIKELAKLHGVFFKNDMLSSCSEWLFHTDCDLYRGLFAGRLPSSLDTFKSRWNHVLTDDFVDVLKRLSGNVNEFMTELNPKHTGDGGADGRPCLFHGDFKTENIFFPKNNNNGRVAMVDFQTITQGSPLASACDAAFFIFGCLDRDISTEEFVEELIEIYYSQLKQVVSNEERMGGYSLEQCRTNIFRGLRWPIIMMVFGGAQFRDTTDAQAKRFCTFIERLQRAAYLFYDKFEQ